MTEAHHKGRPARGRGRLFRLRDKAGLTQGEISRMTGLRQSKISDIERGSADIGNITLRTAAKLAAALGVHAEDLLGADESADITEQASAAPSKPNTGKTAGE